MNYYLCQYNDYNDYNDYIIVYIVLFNIIEKCNTCNIHFIINILILTDYLLLNIDII